MGGIPTARVGDCQGDVCLVASFRRTLLADRRNTSDYISMSMCFPGSIDGEADFKAQRGFATHFLD